MPNPHDGDERYPLIPAPMRQYPPILEGLDVASDRAEQLASELRVVMPELRAKDCAVRVIDSDNNEIYRTPLNPIPAWMRLSQGNKPQVRRQH